MSKHSPFGGQSSVEVLKWLSLYKRLDAKRPQGLNPSEQKQYGDLCIKLGKILDPRSENAIPRRDTLRVTANYEIHLESGEDFRKVYMTNISGGGVYVETTKMLPIGSKLKLKIHIESEEKSIEVEGSVSWMNPKALNKLPPGMGLKFENLGKEEEEFIRKLIHQQLDKKIGKEKE